MTCGSVSACPRCSAVIAHTRAEEIGVSGNAVGGRPRIHCDVTMWHSRRDALLQSLWDALSARMAVYVSSRASNGRSTVDCSSWALGDAGSCHGRRERWVSLGSTGFWRRHTAAPPPWRPRLALPRWSLLFSTRELGVGLSGHRDGIGHGGRSKLAGPLCLACWHLSEMDLGKTGRLHHIGPSAHVRGTTVTVLADDRDVRVLHHDAGTLIRELVLDPAASNAETSPKTGHTCKPCLGTPCNNIPTTWQPVPGPCTPAGFEPD